MINKQNTIKNTIKQKQGITLIALIVTIIVLLILAGITVASLSGDNGLIDKTSEAQFRTEIAQYQEDLDLSIIKEEGKNKRGRTTKFNATSYDDIKKIIPSFHKKYENSLVIEEDKLVFKGNNRDLYKLSYEMGLISSDDLLDDEILEELQPFITEWTVEAGDTITLPISGNGTCDFTVNYGDGSDAVKVTSKNDENRIHNYTTAGTYTVTIKGQCQQFDFSSVNISKDKISKIVQWGVFGNYYSFSGCSNLKGKIPSPSKNSFKNVTNFDLLFKNCILLEGPIPNNLFYNCPNAKRIGYVYQRGCFDGCTSLTGNIPEDLFKNCTNVTDFGSCFRNCKNLTGNIPEKLFEKNTKVQCFDYLFRDCSGLTGNIPENLFKNCISARTFNGTFQNCKNLSGSIPENLFQNCTEIYSLNGAFDACTGLTGNIPKNLFANCTKITTLGNKWNSGLFKGCTGLTGSIPSELFVNCNNITNFDSAFNGCINLTGIAPDLWNRTNVTTSMYCFRSCTNLSNYNQIPKAWGGGGE